MFTRAPVVSLYEYNRTHVFAEDYMGGPWIRLTILFNQWYDFQRGVIDARFFPRIDHDRVF